MANVYRSLNKYVRDNLYTTEGYAVDFEGLAFDDTSVDEWIQFRILTATREFHRQGSTTEYAHTNSLMLNFNTFVKKSGVTLTDKHYMMRDTISNYFKVGKGITMYDYVGSGTTLCEMIVRRILTDTPLPETNELLSYNLTVECSFTEFTLNR